jgi:hypothetical protein
MTCSAPPLELAASLRVVRKMSDSFAFLSLTEHGTKTLRSTWFLNGSRVAVPVNFRDRASSSAHFGGAKIHISDVLEEKK